MSGIVNRLTGNAATLASIGGVGEWQLEDLIFSIDTASELAPDSQFRQIELFAPEISVYNLPGTGKLLLPEIQLNQSDEEKEIVFVFAVKMPSGGVVSTTLVHDDEPLTTTVTTTVNLLESAAAVNAPGVLSPQWFIFRTNPIIIGQPQGVPSVSIEILFSPSQTEEPFYVTFPALYPAYEFAANNIAVNAIASIMPEVMIETDQYAEVSPDVPLLRVIDVATLGLGDSMELTRSFAYLDIEEGFDDSDNETKSALVNHDVADFETMIWLCKFNGTRPVTKFESSLDYLSDPFILDQSTLNSANVLRLTSFTELNPPPLTVEAQEELLRWQLEYGYYGKNAGTLPAVIEATKLMLIGTESASVSYNYDVEPFVIDLKTYWYETYGATGAEVIGESSDLVLEAIEPARPLGTLIRHEMVG
jgi:hypothetical protein